MSKLGKSRRGPAKLGKSQQEALSALTLPHAVLAVKTLAKVCKKGETDAVRVSAATALLDRAYGRPYQSMRLTGGDGGAIKTINGSMTDKQASDAYAATLRGAG